MKCMVMANGEYGEIEYYKDLFRDVNLVICADGGANYAYKIGIMPSCIVGDLDSILPEVRDYFNSKNVAMKKYPKRKDFTDMQLALSLAENMGADEIVLLGSMGKRLDHTLSNLYCGIGLVKSGIKISHYSPECVVYLVAGDINLNGTKGDIVSVMALSETADGVREKGFEYPLENMRLENDNPYAISNVLSSDKGHISLEKGILAVFHYHSGNKDS